jgi:hypothetical protein
MVASIVDTSEMIKGNANLYHVKQLLGHKSFETLNPTFLTPFYQKLGNYFGMLQFPVDTFIKKDGARGLPVYGVSTCHRAFGAQRPASF